MLITVSPLVGRQIRPMNVDDFRSARRGAVVVGLCFGLYLAHVARLDVRLGLARGEFEGEAFLAERKATGAVLDSPRQGWAVLWITRRDGQRRRFRHWDEGLWQRLTAAAREAGAEVEPGLGYRVWKMPPPATAPGRVTETRKWDRFALRVRFAGLGRQVVTGFEVLQPPE